MTTTTERRSFTFQNRFKRWFFHGVHDQPPYLSFAVSDSQYLITLIVMLIVALTLSTLMNSVKHQAEMARHREIRTAALYAMTSQQAAALTTRAVIKISAHHLSDVFSSKTCVLLLKADGQLEQPYANTESLELDTHEMGVAQWVTNNGQMAGIGTSTLPGAKALYMPLRGTRAVIGVIGVYSQDMSKFLVPEEMHLLELFVNQIGLAVERASLGDAADRE